MDGIINSKISNSKTKYYDGPLSVWIIINAV